MQLKIDNQTHTFTPIEEFRGQYGLPAEFGVAHFATETAAYNQLWSKRDTLDEIGRRVLSGIPMQIPASGMTQIPERLSLRFQQQLVAVATETDLDRDELDITVTDFRNVLEAAAYKLFELYYLNGKDPAAAQQKFDMDAIYQDALDGTARLALDPHSYETPAGNTWSVYIVFTNFGPVGLAVEMDDETVYIADEALLFPAADFLKSMSIEAGEAMCDALVAG